MSVAETIPGKLNPLHRLKDMIFGGPGAIVMAIIAAYFALLKGQSGVVDLLRGWGPVFPLSLICIGVVAVYLGTQTDIQRENARSQNELLSQSVEVQRESAAAYGAIAQSLQQIAEKDDRDKQEMQILIGVVNSKVEQTHELAKQTNRSLDEIKLLILNRPVTESNQT